MKTTVDHKRYVFIETEVATENIGPTYRCRLCVADPMKQPSKGPGDPSVLQLHGALAFSASEEHNLCTSGFWARDTKEGRAAAIAAILEAS